MLGGGEYYSFEVIVYRKPRRGEGVGEGILLPRWRLFLGGGDLGVLKPGFWWVIMFKLTSTLAPNVYNDCSIRGGHRFCC